MFMGKDSLDEALKEVCETFDADPDPQMKGVANCIESTASYIARNVSDRNQANQMIASLIEDSKNLLLLVQSINNAMISYEKIKKGSVSSAKADAIHALRAEVANCLPSAGAITNQGEMKKRFEQMFESVNQMAEKVKKRRSYSIIKSEDEKSQSSVLYDSLQDNVLRNPDLIRITHANAVFNMAADIVNLNRDLFKKLPEDALSHLQANYPDYKRFADKQVQLIEYILKDILYHDSPEERAMRFEFWVKVMQECIKSYDYQGASTIIQALNSQPLSRLDLTNLHVKPEIMNLFQQEKERFMDTKRIHSEISNLIGKSGGDVNSAISPVVPPMHVYSHFMEVFRVFQKDKEVKETNIFKELNEAQAHLSKLTISPQNNLLPKINILSVPINEAEMTAKTMDEMKVSQRMESPESIKEVKNKTVDKISKLLNRLDDFYAAASSQEEREFVTNTRNALNHLKEEEPFKLTSLLLALHASAKSSEKFSTAVVEKRPSLFHSFSSKRSLHAILQDCYVSLLPTAARSRPSSPVPSTDSASSTPPKKYSL